VIGLLSILIRNAEFLVETYFLISLFIFLGLSNSISFILLSILIKNKPTLQNPPELCALVVTVAGSIILNLNFFINLTGDSPSSLGAFFLIVLPFYLSLAICVGFLLGFLIKRVSL